MSNLETKPLAPPPAAPLAYEPAPMFQATPQWDNGQIADCQGKRIGILIVTYNAVTTIPKVLKRIPPKVWENVEEVVIFDDASPDPTYELAVGIKILSGIPKLNVLKNPKNLGYGGNQKAGYQYFIDRGFDIVVLLHGDGQYAPEILAQMYHPLVHEQADAVFGSRMLKTYGGPLKGGMPLYKYFGNRMLTMYENWSLGLNLTEFHSGYRAYDLHALKRIDLSRMTNQFHFDTEIIIKLHHQGFRIAEIPVPTYYGDEVCYVNGFKYAGDILRAVRRYKQTVRSVAKFPEFEEYFVPQQVSHPAWSSLQMVRQSVMPGDEVVEFGCGTGLVAAELQHQGYHVTGVDVLPTEQIQPLIEHYVRADRLADGVSEVRRQLGGVKFDKVLLLDVLPRLADPAAFLQQCRDLLQPGGQLVVSVPNVANVRVRVRLLFGRFDYTERGILRCGSLRFFTRRTIRELLEAQGYTVLKQQMAVSRELRSGRGVRVWLARLMPGLFGDESFLTAKLKDSAV